MACRAALANSVSRSAAKNVAVCALPSSEAVSCCSTLRESPMMPTSMLRLRPISAASLSICTIFALSPMPVP